jgi:hypothetical protein
MSDNNEDQARRDREEEERRRAEEANRGNQPATQNAGGPSGGANPLFQTGAEALGMETPPAPTPGLSQAAALREVPNSRVPGTVSGDISHVFGPGQAAVDPIAAGLDLAGHFPSRAENRAITQTGEAAAGPRPYTYIHRTGPEQVPQAAPADGALVQAPTDEVAAQAPGPTSGT